MISETENQTQHFLLFTELAKIVYSLFHLRYGILYNLFKNYLRN